jgi:hypothetical protein
LDSKHQVIGALYCWKEGENMDTNPFEAQHKGKPEADGRGNLLEIQSGSTIKVQLERFENYGGKQQNTNLV